MHSELWGEKKPLLTLVFVGLILGQILQQGFGYGERAAGRHFLDCVDPWEQKGLQVKSLSFSWFAIICFILWKESCCFLPHSHYLSRVSVRHKVVGDGHDDRFNDLHEGKHLVIGGEAWTHINVVDEKTLHRVGRAGGTTERHIVESSSPL